MLIVGAVVHCLNNLCGQQTVLCPTNIQSYLFVTNLTTMTASSAVMVVALFGCVVVVVLSSQVEFSHLNSVFLS